MKFTVEHCHSAAVGRLDHLHEYLIWTLFFSLSGLSKSDYKGHTALFLLSRFQLHASLNISSFTTIRARDKQKFVLYKP